MIDTKLLFSRKKKKKEGTIIPRVLDDLPILILQLSAQTIQLSEQDIRCGLHLFHLDLPEIRSFVHLPSFVPLVRDVPHQLDSFHILKGNELFEMVRTPIDQIRHLFTCSNCISSGESG